MMSWFRFFVLAAVAIGIVGCGGGVKERKIKIEEKTSEEVIKQYLNEIIKSGQGGSEFGLIIQEAAAMKKEHPEKAALADELSKKAEAMMKEGTPDKIKAGAQEMLKLLESGGSGGK